MATLTLSVTLYIVAPVIAAQIIRRLVLAHGGEAALSRLLAKLQPLSLTSLLGTLILLFGFQGAQIIAQPLIIALLAVPILYRSTLTPASPIFLIAYPARNIASPGLRR